MGVAADGHTALLDAAFVDPAFLDLFDLEFIAGDRATALDGPGGVVLTLDAAVRLFQGAPALGQPLLVDNDWAGTVTGVIAPVRQPSFMGTSRDSVLPFEMLGAWASSPIAMEREADNSLFSTDALTFVALPSGFPIESLNARFPAFLDARIPPEQQAAADVVLEATPLNELTTRQLDTRLFARSGVSLSVTGVLLLLGVLTLAVACVNYTNLATAQAGTRAKEVGMRKALGAGRAQIMAQSWIEATMLTLAALVLASAVVALAAPVVETSTNVNLLFFATQGTAPWIVLGGLVALVGVLAGAYPALVMSQVPPADALRSRRVSGAPRVVTKLLVGVQFASASFLLILVTVTQLQRAHIERTALSRHDDPIVVLNDLRFLDVEADTLETLLAREPSIKSVTVTNWTPWDSPGGLLNIFSSPDDSATRTTGYLKRVGYDFFSTFDLDVLAGRVFDRERDPEPTYLFFGDATAVLPFVIDRTFAENLGFQSPQAAVGQIVYLRATRTRPAQPIEIIGVVESDTAQLDASATSGNLYIYVAGSTFYDQVPLVRVAKEDVAGSIAAITRVWDQLSPNTPVNIRFFDELFEQAYRQYARISQLFVLLASAAFVIASIGQLGIAVHVAARRRHEIGVRKALGSTSLSVARLLLIDFSKPALAANMLAWPLAYFAAQAYLSGFAYRIALTPAPFLLSMAITLAVACATVLGEVWKAASVRPADVLRRA